MMAKWIETPHHDCIRGLWEEPEYFTWFERTCSHCGKRSPADGQYPYCPFCGAQMENARSVNNGTDT